MGVNCQPDAREAPDRKESSAIGARAVTSRKPSVTERHACLSSSSSCLNASASRDRGVLMSRENLHEVLLSGSADVIRTQASLFQCTYIYISAVE